MHDLVFFILMVRRAPEATLFPYTTLFRSSGRSRRVRGHSALERHPVAAGQLPRGSGPVGCRASLPRGRDRKSTRLNSSHITISYAVFCLKKKKTIFPRNLARPKRNPTTHP